MGKLAKDGLSLALALGALLAASAILLATPALPHEWYSGQLSPEGKSCCGGYDCAAVPYESVSCDATGCDVTILPGTHPMLPVEDRETCYSLRRGATTYCVSTPGLGRDPITFRYRGNPGLSPDGNAHACIAAPDVSRRNVRCLFVGGLM